jgi:pilus assembly protein TadC
MQAEKYGSSMSEVLKQKSNYMKFEISQNVERKARKVTLMMLFPLVFLILPSFIILVGGPLIFSVGGDFLLF